MQQEEIKENLIKKRKMRKYFIFLTVVFFTIFLRAQEKIVTHEQIALDFFAHEVINKEYKNIKHVLFDGNLEEESPIAYSYCMHFLSENNVFKNPDIRSINIPHNTSISKDLSLFRKIFTSKNKIAKIYVFKHYLMDENVVVVIYLSTKSFSDYYSILIDKDDKRVLDYCKKTYYE